MKKNVMMRVASALLVAVLMTTCAISGTFAKYTTSKTGSDSARVAKFGVVIEANGQTFAKSETGEVDGVVTANTVLSAGAVNGIENVVAPGMSGEMVAMEIEGTPEVAVEVSYESDLALANWTVDSNYYCPIVITVNGTAIEGSNYTSMTAFEEAVEAAIDAFTKEYPAGTDLSGAAAPVVSWSWAFNVSDANDEKDTKLGDAATAATISLTVKTIVTQVD